MKKYVLLMFLLLFTIQASSYAFFGDGPGGAKGKHDTYRPFSHLSKELSLTDQQLEEIQRIQLKMRKDNLSVHNRISELRLELDEALIDEPVKKVKVKNIVKRINEQELLLEEKKIDSMFRIMDVLTVEQKKRLKELRLYNGFMGRGFSGKHPKGDGPRSK